MANKQRGRAGDPARPEPGFPAQPPNEESPWTFEEDVTVMPAYGLRTPTHTEGVAVVGEAIRRLSPDSAEFVIEISTAAPTAAQALRDNNLKTTQLGQAIAPLGVQQSDIQTISLNVHSLFSPMTQALPAYTPPPQIGAAGFGMFGAASGLQQPELQLGSYHARNLIRVNLREPSRTGDIVDAITRAGASILGGFSFRVADEANARRSVLEAAARDARAKAETLATAAGKQVGEPISITEDVVASNGAYAALRSALPFILGAASPASGELEYYARVSASFRFS